MRLIVGVWSTRSEAVWVVTAQLYPVVIVVVVARRPELPECGDFAAPAANWIIISQASRGTDSIFCNSPNIAAC